MTDKQRGGKREGAGRPPLSGTRMKKYHVTLPETATAYLSQMGRYNFSAAFRDYIEWDQIWYKFRDAEDREALEIGANIAIYQLNVSYPATHQFRDPEGGRRLRRIGQAVIAISEHFARHSDATFQDPEIRDEVAIVFEYGRRFKADGNPLELFKSAVGMLVYALYVT